MLEKDM